MRPERLQIQGFTAFREPTVVDFADVDLCAFSGPTGSGKSSLIDAIVFALYGAIPRYDDKRRVAPAISQGLVEARVRLDFSVEGTFYSAVRVVRANRTGTGATTKEARLERHGAMPPTPASDDDAAAESEGDAKPSAAVDVLAGDAAGVTASVEALLGLSFEHFTTCVVLPQGEFSRFLHNKPSDRQALLVRLLDLGLFGRMAALSRERAATVSGRLEQVEARLGDLVTVEPAQQLLLESRVAELAALQAQIDKAAPRLLELDDEEQAVRAKAVAGQDALDRLADISRPEDLGDDAELLASSKRSVADASTDLIDQEEALAAAEAVLERLASRASLEQIQTAWERLDALRAQVAKGESAQNAAVTAHEQALAKMSDAEQAAAVAAEALTEITTKDLAVTLAADLSAGDTCPVCGNEVHKLPKVAKAELTKAKKRATSADKAVDDARRAVQTADTERIRIAEKLAGIADQAADLDTRLADAPNPTEAAASLDEVAAAEAQIVAARTQRSTARDAKAKAEKQLSSLEERQVVARNEFERHRDRVVPLGVPDPDRTDLASDWDQLVDWATEQTSVRGEELAGFKSRLTELRTEAEALDAEITREAMTLGVAVAKGSKVRDAVVYEASKLAAELERIAETRTLGAQLEADRASMTTDHQVASTLSSHLRADGFQKWLLDEALFRLVDGATGLLHQLSGGAYSLTLEPKTSNFAVIDHANADTIRSARTLSGGETFLASLALALALADQVAELAAGGSVHLESIFLDEGFGTLDPDTLDLVAGAIEELGAGGRMVGLVSHVRELALRLPIRFEVTKGPTTSSVERVVT